MARETLGYVILHWTCPHCSTRNPGPFKFCAACGAPQPPDVQFEQIPESQLLTDEATAKAANAGADLHCGYCGARNPAGAKLCSQCNADMSTAKAREAGRVVGSYAPPGAQPQTAPCPACGQPNPLTAQRCASCGTGLGQKAAPPPAAPASAAKVGGISIVIIALITLCVLGLIIFCLVMVFRTTETTGVVNSVQWRITTEIEEYGPVDKENWKDEIPAGAKLGTCQEKYHHTQDTEAPRSKKICGTPYTVDKGTGQGEVVQDCQFEVYADWCAYKVDEWHKVDDLVSSGRDLSPVPPLVQLKANQREGKTFESYKVTFESDGKQYNYATDDLSTFTKFSPGSKWKLTVNGLGDVVSAEPQ